ncbi:hypothetical protein Mia14_0799 [Candidatus Mancarchaeum acidiphilum]|uniref:Uncharacterized protein n=1 Tax=Candidatus Mancarchaeum acidiphilum TaxID=1920749 RepID=A0A218NNQ9_9ARCH|nr:hypothetical protein [Candidatus Mancarchaeum acidiphilum]ASI14092.1 hypothetical protein Mia14_0799 [Candidatus Mancarchaeum acidiphilum]
MDYEKIIDEYEGMINKDQAGKLKYEGYNFCASLSGPECISVEELASLIEEKRDDLIKNEFKNMFYSANIKDRVYRIFNEESIKSYRLFGAKRLVVIGSSPNTLKFFVSSRLSKKLDKANKLVKSSDEIVISNALVNLHNDFLYSGKDTDLKKVDKGRSKQEPYMEMDHSTGNTRIFAKISSLDSSKIIRSGKDSSLELKLDLGSKMLNLILEGSSLKCVKEFNPGDNIFAEFCRLVKADKGLSMVADNYSRVVLIKQSKH